MQKGSTGTIFAPRNRGLLLDIVVFVFNLLLMQIVVRLSLIVVLSAQEDVFAKIAIALFFAGVLCLQPLGPVLKRWSFHQQFKFDSESTAGCLLFWFMFFYLVVMMLIAGAAATLFAETFFGKNSSGETIGVIAFLMGVTLSVVNTILVYRYFSRPKKPPHLRFLATSQAAKLGDICIFLNVICFQILWSDITSSGFFRELVVSTPLGKAGSFTDIAGRLIVVAAIALILYFPPRIFYLAADKHRKATWVTMLMANLPLIFRISFASRH